METSERFDSQVESLPVQQSAHAENAEGPRSAFRDTREHFGILRRRLRQERALPVCAQPRARNCFSVSGVVASAKAVAARGGTHERVALALSKQLKLRKIS